MYAIRSYYAHLLRAAVDEILSTTGFHFNQAWETADYVTCALSLEGSADFLVRCRKRSGNPFQPFNLNPRTARLPNTRLETFVYKCRDP